MIVERFSPPKIQRLRARNSNFQDLFRRQYPQVRFRPEPNLCFADPAGRIVTAGGTTSWHDLALHIISRHVSPGEAMRIAKVYLLKWHDEGQLPYEPLVRQQPHTDAVVRGCETWLRGHFRETGAVARAVGHAQSPERTLKRRITTGVRVFQNVEQVATLNVEDNVLEPDAALRSELRVLRVVLVEVLHRRSNPAAS